MIPLKFIRLWATIGYLLVGLVVVLSLMPAPAAPEMFPWEDKIKHMAAYGVLMLWFAQLYPPKRYLLLVSGFLAMGILLEILQAKTGYRTGDIGDVAANALGTIISWRLAAMGGNGLLVRLESRYGSDGREG